MTSDGADPWSVRPLWRIARWVPVHFLEDDRSNWVTDGLGELIVKPRKHRWDVRSERDTDYGDDDAYEELQTLFWALMTLGGLSGLPVVALAFLNQWPLSDALIGVPIALLTTAAIIAAGNSVARQCRATMKLRENTWAWRILRAALPIGVAIGLAASLNSWLGG